MALSAHKKHKIYLAAGMGYGIGSNDPEELAFYNKVKQAIKDINKVANKSIARED